ncbi:hypothetical protein [Actinoallomurus soli]|uniref:hypothetical protein n=1 Tax=Actinoallomurus soli TaxID=2952535 RepID=UPI002092D5AB|nr:hypothetical protein [Actinoallomurus soli]MCO5967743.1 hypothetical protein [Actinoallomurus soli]
MQREKTSELSFISPMGGRDMAGPSHQRELEALVELCRELIRLGVTSVGMSDARPAVSMRGGLADRKIWVEVDGSRCAFVWCREHHERHTMDDPAGAAARLVEYLRIRNAESGDPG